MSLEKYFARYGKATFTLFLINVSVYVLESILSGNPLSISIEVLARLGQWNYAVLNYGWWWQLISAMFVHVGLLHIAFNMYFLLMMGRQLEGILGPKRLVMVYLVSGLAGNLLTLLLLPANSVSAGASGALFGIVGALILITGVVGGNMQGALINAFVLFLINSILPSVNVYAHLGGLLVGMAIGYYYGRQIKRHLMARMYGYGW
ncbi:rhomboid family intramembrane serine protease [Thermococcus thioreducens]|uniref:Peptidase n=1 Tax=Thermococcus thioreducens TaxID=277988 RepID=A0A0Q2RDP9_9EURY|nr:rhomboid family intramembrane serine protease [Thermococcus thioreducens]ASJ12887.1 rhomboid family intramembrane serine protease [Thermococcus thioreducens]KQH82078.1 peptidase [Thermococcus thioreducens]SEV83809.1 rhomboid protease GluP [Thermococcus thioreducens]